MFAYDQQRMEQKTYSISMRLRRTTVEYAFVPVPLDSNVMEPDPEGQNRFRVNPDKVVEIAKRMASQPDVVWARESDPLIEPHPWQIAPPRA